MTDFIIKKVTDAISEAVEFDGVNLSDVVDTSLSGDVEIFQKVQTLTIPAPSIANVELLRTDATTRGVPANTVLKDIAVDAPAGVSVNANDIRITQENVTLEDTFIGNRKVIVRNEASGFTMRRCLVTNDLSSAMTVRMVDIYAGADNVTIEWCSFLGKGFFGGGQEFDCIVQRKSGSGLDFVAGDIFIRRNEFIGQGTDSIKSCGGGEITDNFFDAPASIPAGTDIYSATTNYSTGTHVYDPTYQYTYRSLTDNNLGNPLPANKNDNANWENIDYHADCANPFAARRPLLIARNYMVRDQSLSSLGNAVRSTGMNNGIRNDPDNGSDLLHDAVTCQHNIITANGPTNETFPISGAQADGVQLIADRYLDNWVGANQNGAYFYTDMLVGNVESGTTAYTPPATPTAAYNGPTPWV